jgi:predicted amino acid racemase
LIGASPDKLVRTEIIALDPTAIDYYALLSVPHEQAIRVGDTVIVASRAQIFVARSYVAVIEGIQKGSPSLAGMFDALGNPVDRIFG